MPTVTLRQAHASDAIAVRELTRQAYEKWVAVIGREPKPMAADYEAAVRKHRFDLVFSDGLLAGLIETIEEPDCLLIENVAVSPGHQGQGLGRLLLAKAEEVAREQGRGRLRLYTNRLFVENIALYQRLDFVVEREEDLGVGVAVHMSKTVCHSIKEPHLGGENRSPGTFSKS